MVTVFFRTIITYFFLLLAIRAMGKRQLGELEVSELVITLMVSELAVLPISDSNIPVLYGIIPILLLLSVEVFMSKLISTSAVIKRLFCGTPSILVKSGRLDMKELNKSRIGIDELMSELRQNGVTRLSDVEYAIIESNGKLSVILTSTASPPTAEDMNIQVVERGIEHNIIINSRVSHRGLFQAGKSERWLEGQLRERNLSKEGIVLLTVNDADEVQIFTKEDVK